MGFCFHFRYIAYTPQLKLSACIVDALPYYLQNTILTELCLCDNEITDSQLIAILRVMRMTSIEKLDVSQNSITLSNLTELLKNCDDSNTFQLDLRENPISNNLKVIIDEKDDELRRQILANLHVPLKSLKIKGLDFSGNNFGKFSLRL